MGDTKPEEEKKPEAETKPEEEKKPEGETKPEGEKKPEGETKPEEEKKPEGETEEVVSVSLSIGIKVEYTENLKNADSEEFKKLASSIEDSLNTVELKASGMSAKVIEFRKKTSRKRRSENLGVEAIVEFTGKKTENFNADTVLEQVMTAAKAAATANENISDSISAESPVKTVENKPEGEKKPEGETKPEGEKKPEGETKPEGERKPEAEEKPEKPEGKPEKPDKPQEFKFLRGPKPMSFPRA